MGRPKIRSKEVKAYDSDTLRWKLRARGIKPCIPRRKMREEAGSQWLGWKIERTFAWLFNFRRVVRWEHDYHIFLAFLIIACIIILLGAISGWLLGGPTLFPLPLTSTNIGAHRIMGDILNEAYAVAQCKECPWYKSCVIPMRSTAEDIRRQLEATVPGTDIPQQADLSIQNLLSSMATAARIHCWKAAPIFIDQLRSSLKLAQRLKELMQNWGREEE